jgi:hypothetical protein
MRLGVLVSVAIVSVALTDDFGKPLFGSEGGSSK